MTSVAWLTVGEVAAAAGVSRGRIYRELADGNSTLARGTDFMATPWRIHADFVETWMDDEGLGELERQTACTLCP